MRFVVRLQGLQRLAVPLLCSRVLLRGGSWLQGRPPWRSQTAARLTLYPVAICRWRTRYRRVACQPATRCRSPIASSSSRLPPVSIAQLLGGTSRLLRAGRRSHSLSAGQARLLWHRCSCPALSGLGSRLLPLLSSSGTGCQHQQMLAMSHSMASPTLPLASFSASCACLLSKPISCTGPPGQGASVCWPALADLLCASKCEVRNTRAP